MRKIISASWVLVSKLKTHNNLFLQDEQASEYLVRAYSCKCSHDEIVTGDDVHKHYICPNCKNDIFFNVNEISPDMKSFVENIYYNRLIKLNFNMTYEVGIYKNKVQAIAKIKIPSEINFIEKKIIKKEVVVVGMPYQDKIEKISRSPFSSTLTKLQKLATNKKLFEPYIDLKLSRSERIKKKQFNFVINHYNLKDLKFMKWTNTNYLTKDSYSIESALESLANVKQYKSVKKAIFDNYEFQLKEYKEFNPNFINTVTSKIDNINHIVLLLKKEFDNSYFEDDILFNRFFDFLLDRYSQKQVVNFFINLENPQDEQNLHDSLLMYRTLKYYLDATVEKVKCSVGQIHTQFVKLSQKLEYKNIKLIKFQYSDTQLSFLKEIDKYNVRLPQNNHELFAWSNILSNCLASYDFKIEAQLTTVYGFFIQNKLIFAVEIANNLIVQAYRKHNMPLSSFQNKVLYEWYEGLG